MIQDESQPSADLGLAFVDVITNGLGAMLVLFFVVVMVQGSLEWSASAESPTRGDLPEADPWVLLVQTGNPVFDVTAEKDVWRSSGWSEGSLSDRRGQQWDWGESHAVLLTPRPPGAGASLDLQVRAGGGEMQVELHHGKRHWTRTVPLPAEGGWVSVWPWPGESGENVR